MRLGFDGTMPQNPGVLLLLRNNGSGLSFTESTSVVGLTPSDLAIGDIDGANGPDVAVSNEGSDSVTLLVNDVYG